MRFSIETREVRGLVALRTDRYLWWEPVELKDGEVTIHVDRTYWHGYQCKSGFGAGFDFFRQRHYDRLLGT